MISRPRSDRDALEEQQARQVAERLLLHTRRSSLLTLEAAMVKVRPLRRGCRRAGDVHDTVDAVVTLSRLAMRSADRLDNVVCLLLGCGLHGWDHGAGPGH